MRAELTPGPPLSVSEAAGQVVAEQLRELRRQRRKVRRGDDAEPVHAMRVATRRLRTALRAVRGHVVVPRRLRTDLKHLARRLGTVRDQDVMLALLGGVRLAGATRDERMRLAELVAWLGKRRRKALAALQDDLRRSRFRPLEEALGIFAARPVPAGADVALAARVLAEVSESLGDAVARNAAMTAALPAAEALHELRIAFKRLRYALDFHASASGLSYEVERRLARELQDVLGAIHDRDLLLGWLAEGRGRFEGPWPRLSAQLGGERARLVRRFRRLRGEWARRTRPEPDVAPLQSPRFVNLDVQPVTLRLVTGPRSVA